MNVNRMCQWRSMLIVTLTILPLFIYSWYIYKYGVNVPFLDDWTGIVSLMKSLYLHKLTISNLWMQHNENRMIFPNIIYIVISLETHLNTKALMYVSLLFLVGCGLLIFLWYKSRFSDLVWFIPISWLLFSLIQWGDTLWGFELAWYMVLFFTLLSFYCLERIKKKYVYLWFSLISAIIASYSSAQGLIVWPVGLAFIILMLFREDKRFWLKILYYWVSFMIITCVIYFNGFNFANIGEPRNRTHLYALLHIKNSVCFFFNSLGGVIPPLSWINIIVGIIILLYIGYTFYIFISLRAEDQKISIIYIMLILFGIFFQVFILIGRSPDGPERALTTNYTLYYIIEFIGLYMFLLFMVHNKNTTTKLNKPLLLGFIVLTFIQVLVSFNYGISLGRIHKNAMNATKNVILFNNESNNLDLAVINDITPYDFPNGSKIILENTLFLRHYRLNMFYGKYSSQVYLAYSILSRKYPEWKNAICALFNLYLVRFDLQNAFPVTSSTFEKKLIIWASNSSDTTIQITPFANEYALLKLSLAPCGSKAHINFNNLTVTKDTTRFSIDNINNHPFSPGTSIKVRRGQPIIISGWAIDLKAQKPASAIFFDIDGTKEVEMFYGQERGDVAQYFHNAAYDFSGFSGAIDTSSMQVGCHTFRLQIVTNDRKRYYNPGFTLVVDVL